MFISDEHRKLVHMKLQFLVCFVSKCTSLHTRFLMYYELKPEDPPYAAKFYDCCGAEDPNASGCSTSFHVSYDDDSVSLLPINELLELSNGFTAAIGDHPRCRSLEIVSNHRIHGYSLKIANISCRFFFDLFHHQLVFCKKLSVLCHSVTIWFFCSLNLQNFEPVKMGVKKEDGSLCKIMPPEEQEILDEMDIKVKKYLRGGSANFEALRDKKLKGQLAVKEELYGKSAKAAAKVEKWLMPSEGGYLEVEGIEKTWRIKQEAIVREVDISSSKNQYDIVLPDLGPYTLDFTSSGRYMAVAGRKGHLAIIDMMNMGLIKELQVRETVRDVVFLHNELFFAAAQKKYTYIYNRDGTELHCLKEHGAVSKLQFLKNHFLLASINKFGQLHYQDVTTGLMVGNFRTGLGGSDVMQVNPFNSVVTLGHSNGSVTMWKPTSAAPLVKMLTHHGPVSALSFHSNGHLMATAGTDRKIKIWDLRKYEVLQTLPGHAKTLDFSQKGLLATSTGSFVQILGDFSGSQNYSRYMTHSIAKGYQIRKVLFRPYEDVLGLGHSMGWSSILIPGSGEPNFDTWVANPFETPKQRREKEVRSLLDKLPPETIMLDPKKIGNLRPPTRRKEKPSKEEREAEMEAAVADAKNSVSTKRKTKGRNKPSRRAKKMQEAVERAKRPFLEQQKQEEELSKSKKQKISEQSELPKSLQRFVSKKAAS
ncbi:hypothetical protein RHGRI_008844 [Rhododendron griersonianum]|uniref:BING4 C-terminal domain-containing protein n=1 Tax=Rhododendron griersonianum TaxID=479676 RepID=A0AAV6L478_9ERIC|nr:hypothetical protein RHGRI_008844 [Rhododendron griersonianum]KAG5559061.1 hypothetical protein RHGRI_008844 [Rhododendron griersonianum]